MSTNKTVNKLINDLGKKFGLETIKLGSDVEEMKFYKTPSNDVNEALGGYGIAVGRIIEFFGENSSGKTSFALGTIAENQRIAREKAIADGKDNYQFMAGWFETEQSFDKKFAKELGIDLDQFVYWDQKDVTAEKGLDILISLVASGQFKIIVINSIAGLCPTAEIEGEMGDANMALKDGRL